MSTIVALGDSTTRSVGLSGVSEQTAWQTLLEAELHRELGRPVKIINAGVDADVAPLVWERLEKDVLRHNPDWVVINLGTNDAGYFRPPDSVADTPRVPLAVFAACMREIIQHIADSGARVVLCTSVPMSGNYSLRDVPAYVENGLNYLVEQYAETTRELSREFGLPLVDIFAAFQQCPERDDMIPDGIHPNNMGQRLIADTILPALRDVLGET
ncbi:MAG: hypothetical protein HN742_01395 [Lentisphaerae bacterium]|nr:hypothetical protein [Lentisphaerota bacterium]MBT4817873.1 hypothetical protein [Lentisphaerota bacterium]MBT5612553.1 hypothetical protein [Lentisphaerota bacterium]MBT7061348.1 hypothetical protein [Lentisphaerota bacterium]MBT7840489.1 hypothetical protein [Lentisphaerota bacterium]